MSDTASSRSSWRRPRVGDEAPIDFVSNIPFLSVHLGCLLVLWTGIGPLAAAVGFASLAVRMFGLTGGYHRYFCHRSYETGRIFQFVLGWLGAAAAQMGPLWWASHHRHHHREADTEGDVHPPGVKGFFWAHMGWIMSPSNADTDYERVGDLTVFQRRRTPFTLMVDVDGRTRSSSSTVGAGVAPSAGSPV